MVAGRRPGGARRKRCRLAPFATALLLLLATGACTPGPAGRNEADTPTPLVADLTRLSSGDGLLFPPELYSAPERSALSETLRNLALSALDEPVIWSGSGPAVYARLTDETDDRTAAALLVEAGLTPPVRPETAANWLTRPAGGVAGPDELESLWQAAAVARKLGLPVDLPAAVVRDLFVLHTDPSPWVQWQAAQLLSLSGHGRPAPEPAEAWLATLRRGVDPNEWARDLYGWVALHPGTPGLRTDLSYWEPLLQSAAHDDYIHAYAVRAFAAAKRFELARAVADRFDRRRLVDGGVLEPLVFVGSLGSTFRMVRYLRQRPDAGDVLDARRIDALLAAVTPLARRDLSHRLASTAITHLLRPGTVPADARAVVVREALRAAGADAPVLKNAETVMGWLSIAEYAVALDVPMRSPRITPAALEPMLRPDDETRYAVSRLLLALQDVGSPDTRLLRRLGKHLSRSFAGRSIDDQNSLLLFSGSLALRRAGFRPPYPMEKLAAEADRRRGECLGGLDTFIRESPQPGSACNVEASRYAARL